MTEITSQVKPKCVANCDAIPVKLCPALVLQITPSPTLQTVNLFFYIPRSSSYGGAKIDWELRSICVWYSTDFNNLKLKPLIILISKLGPKKVKI